MFPAALNKYSKHLLTWEATIDVSIHIEESDRVSIRIEGSKERSSTYQHRGDDQGATYTLPPTSRCRQLLSSFLLMWQFSVFYNDVKTHVTFKCYIINIIQLVPTELLQCLQRLWFNII